jgi:sugar phosphate permease
MGSSLAFILTGILGASLAPYIATWLATTWGLRYVGYYLSASAVLTLLGLLLLRETKDDDLTTEPSMAPAPGTADAARSVVAR